MKLIPLTQGKFAQVDDCDFDWLNQWKWYAKTQRDKAKLVFYAVRNSTAAEGGKRHTVFMHRQIMGEPALRVDHKNGEETLNNCRENLRLATSGQNNCNRSKNAVSKFRFKGVRLQHKGRRFEARILQQSLGHFDTDEEAARAYDKAAVELFGEFARLNFPATKEVVGFSE